MADLMIDAAVDAPSQVAEVAEVAEVATATVDDTDGTGFRDFGLSEGVLQALDELGYEAPTPVQCATIRVLLEGRDVIAQAQTGTGKTAAYGIPLVEYVDAASRRPQALVLAPTRELAVQVAEAVHQFGKHRGVEVLPVYGGQPMERQLRGLRAGVHVVVGTPGRILDHLRRGTLDLGGVRRIVLDEVDEMLDMGFLEDVETILGAVEEARGEGRGAQPDGKAQPDDGAGVPSGVQRAMFSAMVPAPIERLARRFLHDPVRITIAPEQVTVPQIKQLAYEVGGTDKLDALARVLDVETPGSAIVFCATRRAVDEVADRLAGRGFRAAALHGDMAQAERERVLHRFRAGQIEVLVATDVAARGLDIEGVTHVINFDIPWDPESYVHRIGRTGRAGRAGDAITLVTPRDYRPLRTIEQLLGSRITRKRLPSLGDLAARRREAAKAAVSATIAGGDLDPYLVLAGELGDQFDPVEVAGAALRLWDQARTATTEGTTLAGVLRAAEVEAAHETLQAERARQDAQTAAELEADGLMPETGMKRILVAAGRADGLRPQDLVGAIANEADLPGHAVGAIDIYDRFSYVEVPRRHAARVVRVLSRTTLRGRRVGARLVGGEGPKLPARPERRGQRRTVRSARVPGRLRGRSGRPSGRTAAPATISSSPASRGAAPPPTVRRTKLRRRIERTKA